MGCTSKMTRIKTSKLEIEEWHLPGDVVMVEVSQKAANTLSKLRLFERKVVEKLLHAGVKPSERSKTELGSNCQ